MREDIISGIEISYETIPSKQMHWHDTLQIVYQLAGKSKISLHGQQYIMHESDMLAVNPFELHNVELLGASAAVSFQFSQKLLEKVEGLRFACNSCLYAKKEQTKFDPLRAALAAIFSRYYAERPREDLELLSHTYELLHLLSTRFRSEESAPQGGNQSRISSILQYLNTHYAEEITLRDLAGREYLSPNYLSQFFRDRLHTTFTQYLSDIRLAHGFFELCNTGKSVTEIALDNGFGRVDAFIERFRRKYEITPGKYRKGLMRIDAADPKLIPAEQDAAHCRALGTRFQALLRYAARPPETVLQALPPSVQTVSVRTGAAGKQIEPDWKTIINAGYADDCCTAEVQQQLAVLQKTIGFEYVRFHGIFSDTMHIYGEDTAGEPKLHFTYADLLLDRLLALGFKPYIEFGFLPEALSGQTRFVYQNRSHIGYPKDIRKWSRLVRDFLLHCMERYGRGAVRQWRFSLFSITFSLYGFLTAQEYATLYAETRRAVKQADEALLYGGPGFEGSLLLDGRHEAAHDFFRHCVAADCVPDFVTMQSFPHSSDEIACEFNRIVHQNDLTASFALSQNESFMADAISAMRDMLARYGLERLPIIIEEWNSTIWQRDLCSDTCYKSVYIVKNLLETMGTTGGKAYWTVSDLINDWKIDGKLFHGGHGLFTYNGLPKASFYAFQFLSRMGTELLSAGNGWYITRGGGSLQILLYHYCHYNALYRMLLEFHDPAERYSAFQKKAPLEVHIDCLDAEGESFVCEYLRISRASGSALDEWIRMGAPEMLTGENLTYLRHRSEPVRWIEHRRSLRDIRVRLEPLEVVLICVRL